VVGAFHFDSLSYSHLVREYYFLAEEGYVDAGKCKKSLVMLSLASLTLLCNHPFIHSSHVRLKFN